MSGTTRSLSDIRKRSRSLAHGLRKEVGVKPGDVVATFCPNTIDYAITLYGLWGCGATVSLVNAAASVTELQPQLQISGAKYLIVHRGLIAIAKAATAAGATDVKCVLQADGLEPIDGVIESETVEKLASSRPGNAPLSTIPGDEVNTRLALLCFSSGTTGTAKGVMSTHYNMVSNMQQWLASGPSVGTLGSTVVAFVPFSHLYGLATFMLMAVYCGVTVVVMPPGSFNLELYLDTVQRWRSEQLMVVPPVMVLLAKDPRVENYSLGSVRRIINAAAPMTDGLRQGVVGRFKSLYGTQVDCYSMWG